MNKFRSKIVALMFLAGAGLALFLVRGNHAGKTEPGSRVEIYVKDKSWNGFNLTSDCELYDMQGRLLQIFPGFLCIITRDGNIVSQNGDFLIKFDSNLIPKWKVQTYTHHDVSEAKDGTIFAIGTGIRTYQEKKFHFNTVEKITPDGKLKKVWDSFDNIKILSQLLAMNLIDFNREKPIKNGDVPVKIKINSLQVIPENQLGKNNPIFREGNVLIGVPHFGLLIILDQKSFEVVWSYKSQVIDKYFSHSAQMLESGEILLFNNSRISDGSLYSSIIKIDPVEMKTTWELVPVKKKLFNHSPTEGDVQQLPNGNLLITHIGNNPGAIEINANDEIVWGWKRSSEKNHANVYRVRRIFAKVAEALFLFPRRIGDFPQDLASTEHFRKKTPSIAIDSKFALLERREATSLYGPVQLFGFKQNNDKIILEEYMHVDKVLARKIIDDKLDLYLSVYRIKNFKYPTMQVRSKRAKCKDFFLKKVQSNMSEEYTYIFGLNENYSLVECGSTPDNSMALAFLQCKKSRAFYVVKSFSSSPKRAMALAEAISCS